LPAAIPASHPVRSRDAHALIRLLDLHGGFEEEGDGCGLDAEGAGGNGGGVMDRREFVAAGVAAVVASQMPEARGAEGQQGGAGKLIGAARRLPDRDAAAGYLVSLAQAGDGVEIG